MDAARTSPNIISPVVATILALLGLALCLMSVAFNSQAAWYMIWAAMLFIGSAVLRWVNYLRQYIDFRINEEIQKVALPANTAENSQGALHQP